MGPFPLQDIVGQFGTYFIYLLIGMGFGASLEMAGFARSTKLTAQFYLKDMTVLKVMFTGVLVAMLLTFGSVALGILDFDRIWVPPTYLWPGILGGFLVGVGFIIGGFCPGTSLAGAATLKIDSYFFLAGILLGILLFGENLDKYVHFWNSSYMGRFTLPELLGLSVGVTVFVVTLVGIIALWGGQLIETASRKKAGLEPFKVPRWAKLGAVAMILAAFGIMVIGQPSVADRWERVAVEKEAALANREVQIHPAELRDVHFNSQVNLVMLDLRDEADFNLFHIDGAKRTSPDELEEIAQELKSAPQGTVTVLMSNDETLATEGWRTLAALSVPNIYILEGGLNHFIGLCSETPFSAMPGGDEVLRWDIHAALGGNHPTSTLREQGKDFEYTPKVKIEKAGPVGGGGCG